MPARLLHRPRPAAPAAPPAPPAPPLERLMADAVSAKVGAARFALWFQGHARFVGLGSELVVVARTDSGRDWLEHTFGEAVRAAAAAVAGPMPVRWAVDGAAFAEPGDGEQGTGNRGRETGDQEQSTEDQKPAATEGRGTKDVVRRTKDQTDLFGDPVPPRRPKPKRADPEAVGFDPALAPRAGRRWKGLAEFVVGACNRVAHASAASVVEDPGQGANPLVLHGPTGVGKTHLLEGVFAGLRRAGERPCYVTAEEFTTRFVQASRLGKMGAFRRQFRECSALLLDNLNFLATKRATQEEFLNTFDSLVADGRQVVVTTDCHPRLADDLMPELADRLLGGAVWGLLPPDPDTRLEILRKKATAAGPPVPDGTLKYLAGHLRGNVRELEGAVTGVRHYAKVTGRPADAALAREALGDLLRHAVRVVTVADVDAAVCAALRLAGGTLQSKARTWAVTHPRMVAVYLCRKHTAATYGEIAKHFGAKTHSTAVAAEKKVRAWLAADARVSIGDRDWPAKELVDRVERELQR